MNKAVDGMPSCASSGPEVQVRRLEVSESVFLQLHLLLFVRPLLGC